ncbi:protein kinase [Pseudoalteromonas fenneropenaei]|uniref:Protein kinase n=1 Tax=Pseudoalteromonas fenneropenaei TaxID=1737459 RepID=A0ABV7CIW6_9GAMM
MISINEHYSNITRLAQSGMGEVYVATDTRLDRKVAIKFIKSHLGSNADVLREAKLLARLNHPNIVQLYDVKDSAQGLYLEMEYVAGQTLNRYVQCQPLTLEQKLELLFDIAQGLAAAHEQHILHLDLKPGNVLIDDKGRAKIADFGIAQLRNDETSMCNTSYGSLTAMSPEQLQQQPLDQRSDLFSFGLIAFEILAGKHAFGEGPDKLIAERVKSTKAPNSVSQIYGVPAALTDLIDRLLERKRDNRPANAQEVTQQLKQILTLCSFQDANSTMDIAELNLSNKPSKLRLLLASVAFICIAVSTFVGYQYWQANKPKIYVAALPLEFSDNTQLLEAHKQILNLAINDAIKQYFLNDTHYVLISDSEVNLAKKLLGDNTSLKDLGHALNAEQLLAIQLNCTLQSCDIEFSSVDGQNAALIKNLRNVSSSENYGEIFNITQASLAALSLQPLSDNPKLDAASDERLSQYVTLQQKSLSADADLSVLLPEIEKLIKIFPDFLPLYSLYARNTIKDFRNTSDKSLLYRLKDIFDTAPNEFKDSSAYQVELMQLYLYLQDTRQATKALAAIQNSALDEFQKQAQTAVFYSMQKDDETALKHIEIAFKLRPTLNVTRNAAILNLRLGRYDQALPYLKKAQDYAPQDFKTLKTIADVSLMLGKLTEAADAYKRLIAHATVNFTILNNYSVVLTLQGNLTTALDYAQKTAEIASDNIETLINLADLYLLTGKVIEANNLYQEIVEKHDQKGIELTQAQALAHLGQFQAALTLVEEIILQTPDSAEAYYVKTLVQTLLGEKFSASASLQQSLNLGWNAAFYRLAWFKSLCDIQSLETKIGKDNYAYLCQPADPN